MPPLKYKKRFVRSFIFPLSKVLHHVDFSLPQASAPLLLSFPAWPLLCHLHVRSSAPPSDVLFLSPQLLPSIALPRCTPVPVRGVAHMPPAPPGPACRQSRTSLSSPRPQKRTSSATRHPRLVQPHLRPVALTAHLPVLTPAPLCKEQHQISVCSRYVLG